MAEFCLKALAEASEFFFKNIANELHLQRQIADEAIKKLQSELRESKDEHKQRLDFFEQKLRGIELEKAELSAKEQSLKEAYTQSQKERNQLEQEMNERLNEMKKDHARLLEEARNKVAQSEEQQKEIHRQRLAADSEHEKQRALLE